MDFWPFNLEVHLSKSTLENSLLSLGLSVMTYLPLLPIIGLPDYQLPKVFVDVPFFVNTHIRLILLHIQIITFLQFRASTPLVMACCSTSRRRKSALWLGLGVASLESSVRITISALASTQSAYIQGDIQHLLCYFGTLVLQTTSAPSHERCV